MMNHRGFLPSLHIFLIPSLEQNQRLLIHVLCYKDTEAELTVP